MGKPFSPKLPPINPIVPSQRGNKVKKKCYECNGTGLIGSYGNVTCYQCKGKGYIKSEWEKEFEYKLFSGDRMKEIVINKVSIEAIIKNQFDRATKKLKIKVRKNCIQIERIGQ